MDWRVKNAVLTEKTKDKISVLWNIVTVTFFAAVGEKV